MSNFNLYHIDSKSVVPSNLEKQISISICMEYSERVRISYPGPAAKKDLGIRNQTVK